MNIKRFIYFFILLGIVASCSTPEEKQEKKILASITDYMEANKGKQDVVDSIVIIDVDTLTPHSYLFLYQQSLQTKADGIWAQIGKAEEEGNEELSSSLNKENTKTLTKLDSCTQAYESPTVDKSTVWGYFVITKVYIKHPDNTVEAMDIGFPLKADFKVYEMDL